MVIFDVKCILDVERYRKINVNAQRPEDVYPDPQALAPESNTQFLERCVRLLTSVSFANRETGFVYARMEAGRLTWIDREALEEAMMDSDTRAGLLAVAPDVLSGSCLAEPDKRQPPISLEPDRMHILGQWGPTAAFA
jgi:hypothetical protein